MLVLSRRPEQGIVFPNIGVTVRILAVNGSAVKIGIEAPPDIKVHRQELLTSAGPMSTGPNPKRAACHDLCNRLSRVTLALHLFEKQWEAGLTDQARETFANALNQLEKLDRSWVLENFAGPPAAPAVIRPRTLVVEDDANERELLAGLLRMNGCECETAADGDDALLYLDSHERPDFVLLDMLMPRCDGPQTISRIRQNPRYSGLKVFSISGTCPADLGVRSGADGIDAWFPKPLNPRNLWQAMQQNMPKPVAN